MQGRLVRRILLIAGLLSIIVVVGTVGFVLIEGYPWFDAFYMTITTITTVGYQEVRSLSRAGRVFNSFLILVGVSAMFSGGRRDDPDCYRTRVAGSLWQTQEKTHDRSTA